MAETCNTCSRLKTKCKAELNRTYVVLHTDIATIKGNNKHGTKKTFLEKFEKCVAALRNTDGGFLIIHIDGQEAWDRNLEDFDQCFGKCIEDQIEGGQLFTNTCKRIWISLLEEFEQFNDCVLIEVEKTDGVVTVDFNTRLRSDFENRKPSCINIISLLHLKSETSGPNPILVNSQLREGEEICIEESRRVELKTVKPDVNDVNASTSSLDGFINYIWKNLKLKDNISSLSKVKHGGSFIVGLRQVTFTCKYKTKKTKVEGFELHVNRDDFLEALQRKFSTDLCILSGQTFEDFDTRKVDTKLHIVNTNPEKFILEVAVGHVRGVVFYDKQGPRTYLMENDSTKRMSREEWLRRMRTIRIPDRPTHVDTAINTSQN